MGAPIFIINVDKRQAIKCCGTLVDDEELNELIKQLQLLFNTGKWNLLDEIRSTREVVLDDDTWRWEVIALTVIHELK